MWQGPDVFLQTIWVPEEVIQALIRQPPNMPNPLRQGPWSWHTALSQRALLELQGPWMHILTLFTQSLLGSLLLVVWRGGLIVGIINFSQVFSEFMQLAVIRTFWKKPLSMMEWAFLLSLKKTKKTPLFKLM